jgi:uncharacterized repeat protein (TIGR03803 family)
MFGDLRTTIAKLSSAVLFAVVLVAAHSTQAQTFAVLHNFTGGADGANPWAGLTWDRAGNLYGTTQYGGIGSYGAVYKLTHKGSSWVVNPLYGFTGGSDGARPQARVVFGPNDTLYGTTGGGGSEGVGTVFNLRPQPNACANLLCPWMETVLYSFRGLSGYFPGYGDLIFDQADNIYGTTQSGGYIGLGTVYQLTPAGSGWAESVLYSFKGGRSDGENPFSSVIFDKAGNLYGTTYGGSSDYGTVFELTYSAESGWTETILYSFQNPTRDGAYPYAGMIFDPAGNLYGATTDGGSDYGGTVFKLTPSGGSWTWSLVYSFTGNPKCGPVGTLVMDGAGNLYGTTLCDGANNAGSVFKLTPSGISWAYTSLHDFTGGSDGGYPYCNVVLDGTGNLYGTTSTGGTQNVGVVFEITH